MNSPAALLCRRLGYFLPSVGFSFPCFIYFYNTSFRIYGEQLNIRPVPRILYYKFHFVALRQSLIKGYFYRRLTFCIQSFFYFQYNAFYRKYRLFRQYNRFQFRRIQSVYRLSFPSVRAIYAPRHRCTM